MATSKKGWRTIIVNEQKFYWKFNGKVIVQSDEIKNGLLIVDFGWQDVWFSVNDKDNKINDFEPKVITPQFVCNSISFALGVGWKNRKIELEFKNSKYTSK